MQFNKDWPTHLSEKNPPLLMYKGAFYDIFQVRCNHVYNRSTSDVTHNCCFYDRGKLRENLPDVFRYVHLP